MVRSTRLEEYWRQSNHFINKKHVLLDHRLKRLGRRAGGAPSPAQRFGAASPVPGCIVFDLVHFPFLFTLMAVQGVRIDREQSKRCKTRCCTRSGRYILIRRLTGSYERIVYTSIIPTVTRHDTSHNTKLGHLAHTIPSSIEARGCNLVKVMTISLATPATSC